MDDFGRTRYVRGLVVCMGLALIAGALVFRPDNRSARGEEKQPAKYQSPFDVAYSPDGRFIAVSDHTAGALHLVKADKARVERTVALEGRPAAVAWSADGSKVYVSEYGAGSVAEVEAAAGKVARRFRVSNHPLGLAFSTKLKSLVVVNTFENDVSVIDVKTGAEKGRVAAVREPYFVSLARDGTLAVVGNLCPLGDANSADVAARVSLIDLEKLEKVADVPLPLGASSVRDVAVSADGKWAYVAHNLGRINLPTTQLDRGWVNTNALSILDLNERTRYATVLLDQLSEGAANPWGLALSPDGKTLWVTLSGVHQVGKLDLARLHPLMAGDAPEEKSGDVASGGAYAYPAIWTEIKNDPAKRQLLTDDLAALYAAGLFVRKRLPGNGPRGIAICPDGKTLAIAMYFSSGLVLVDAAGAKVLQSVKFGEDRPVDIVRRGEQIFHDAHYCFQHWLSCVTCHPNTRVDGMNWDLLNDGIGNPKNTKSLLLSYKTPPAMSLAVRASMDEAVLAGFRHIQFLEVEPTVVDSVREYLRSLVPEPSPHLEEDGSLSESAKRGKALFEAKETACSRCHPGPLFTDLRQHDVGTRGIYDREEELRLDTPTLIECWRTAPYLHDGSATTILEVLKDRNKDDTHGRSSHLSDEELRDLAEYVLSL